MSSFSVDSTCFSHLLFVYGSYIQKSKACMAYAASSLSFQLNSAEEVKSKPEMFSLTCTNWRSPWAYHYGSTCSSAGVLQRNPSPQPCALLAERRALIQIGFYPQGRKSAWHQPTFPKSCSDAPWNVQPLLLFHRQALCSLTLLLPDWHQLRNADQLSYGRPAVLMQALDLDCPENPWQILTHPL